MASDDIGGIQHPRVKLIHGADGVNAGDVANANPLPAKITDGTLTATVRDTGSSDSLNVAIVDASGNQITTFGGGTQYTEDAAAAADPVGTAPILVRKDTPAATVTTDGDNIAQRGTNYGAAYVQVVTSAGAYVDSFGGGTQYTEDAASAADPVGNMMLARRKDTTSTTEVSLDGDNIALNANNRGELRVQETSTIIDDAAFTPGTSRVLMVGAEFDNVTPDSVDEGDGGALRMSANRNLFMTIRDAAGNERGMNVDANGNIGVVCNGSNGAIGYVDSQFVDDAVFTPATSRVFISGATFDDVTPDSVNEGDGGALRMSANRNLYNTIRDAAGNERGANVDASNRLNVASTIVANGGVIIGYTGGGEQHDVPVSTNPFVVAAYASASQPTAVSAGGDVCRLWTDLNGRLQVQLAPSTSRGLTPYKLISAATTNAQFIKASAGNVYGYEFFNNGPAPVYVKLYNKASAPTVGTDVPVKVWMVPAEGGLTRDVANGISLGTGIAIAITSGIADTNTTAISADQVIVNLDYL